MAVTTPPIRTVLSSARPKWLLPLKIARKLSNVTCCGHDHPVERRQAPQHDHRDAQAAAERAHVERAPPAADHSSSGRLRGR
jgi:hypothetical protein